MSTYDLTTNRHARALQCWAELEHADIAQWFGDDYEPEGDEQYTPRFFKYRGMWFDVHDFEPAPADVKALGFDGISTESNWDAYVICYFDRDGYALDDEVIVGYLQWQ